MSSRLLAALCAALALLLPFDASAHLVSTRFGELYSGLTHPITAMQHVLPWLGLGLIAGLAAGNAARAAIVAFPAAAAAGALAKGLVPGLPPVSALVFLSIVAVGLALAANVRPRAALFVSAAIVIGAIHGLDNGTALLDGRELALYVIGVGLAAYLVFVLASALARFVSQQPGWGVVALRATGSWIAAVGLVFSSFVALNAPP